MRSGTTGTLLVAFLPVIALAACEGAGDGGTSSGSFESEAGGFEAGPSGDSGFAHDSSFLPDATMGSGVTVIVGETGALKSGVRVIFQDSSGAVIGQGTTDATGTVVSTALPSMVTVLYSSPVGPAPLTFLGVNDGDTLRVVPAFQAVPDGTQVGMISVTLAANTIVANSPFLYYYVQASGQCTNHSETSPITGPLFDYCVRPTNKFSSRRRTRALRSATRSRRTWRHQSPMARSRSVPSRSPPLAREPSWRRTCPTTPALIRVSGRSLVSISSFWILRRVQSPIWPERARRFLSIRSTPSRARSTRAIP